MTGSDSEILASGLHRLRRRSRRPALGGAQGCASCPARGPDGAPSARRGAAGGTPSTIEKGAAPSACRRQGGRGSPPRALRPGATGAPGRRPRVVGRHLWQSRRGSASPGFCWTPGPGPARSRLRSPRGARRRFGRELPSSPAPSPPLQARAQARSASEDTAPLGSALLLTWLLRRAEPRTPLAADCRGPTLVATPRSPAPSLDDSPGRWRRRLAGAATLERRRTRPGGQRRGGRLPLPAIEHSTEHRKLGKRTPRRRSNCMCAMRSLARPTLRANSLEVRLRAGIRRRRRRGQAWRCIAQAGPRLQRTSWALGRASSQRGPALSGSLLRVASLRRAQRAGLLARPPVLREPSPKGNPLGGGGAQRCPRRLRGAL